MAVDHEELVTAATALNEQRFTIKKVLAIAASEGSITQIEQAYLSKLLNRLGEALVDDGDE